MVNVKKLFQYTVYTKGLAAAIVLVKSLTTEKTLTINFTFDLTNLVADAE